MTLNQNESDLKEWQMTDTDRLRLLERGSQPFSPVFKLLMALGLLFCILMLSACCGKPQVIHDFQRPQIPPALLVPRTQIEKFAGTTCDDLAGYTFYVIEDRNNCAADINALQNMVR